ncbi:hypothetical protein HHK36_020330 [Tetracentron sinense]|uniref:Disease resistance protein RPM1-like n=1 Tax=Tetracentron sinense TaxID=13715 RepID=A0A834YV81_TETSI|nr:hypothetical protein HHK36_020330 [Tetracentron sinense]
MAEIAVNFVLDRLALFLEQEVNLFRGVRRKVKYIKDELQSIRGFLRDVDAREESEEVKAWIQDIKAKIIDVRERRQGYGLNLLEQGFCSKPMRDSWHDHRLDALLLEEAELVGIDKPRKKLIGWLVEGGSRLQVVSVYGMGGLGKTTLVKKVYDHQRVIEHFQHHAWINVSQSFKINELLIDMIKKLFGEIRQPVPQGLDTMGEVAIKMIVKEFLQQKRYVVIVDDIWSIHAWEAIKYALPDSNCGSRIMVTTRSSDIASYCKEPNGHVYNLESLAPKDSWTLFCNKAFQENSCPPALQGLSENILKRCGGLPLAIVAIGGVLSTREKIATEWEMVHRSLGSLLEINDKLESMKNILLLSYNDLPYYLKPCLLYLGIFPEDYLIGSLRLIKLWTAEGFVREKERMTAEEVAESHLYELISRSLIQVAERSPIGKVKRCRVHDFIREIILSKLRDQNFGAIAIQHNTRFLEKVRRLSIHNSVGNVPQNNSLSHLRSLFMFGLDTIPKSYVNTLFSNIRLLSVLDLRDAPLEKIPNEIVNLFHLRYLSLRRTKIEKLPRNIGKLLNLRTLDLKGTNIRELSSDLFKLQWLRHLIVYKDERLPYSPFCDLRGFYCKVGIGSLVNLQELSFMDVRQVGSIVRELGRLSQLRELGIMELRRQDGPELCSSIEKMNNLRGLNVKSLEEEVLDLQFLSSPPLLLQQLQLRGNLEKLDF